MQIYLVFIFMICYALPLCLSNSVIDENYKNITKVKETNSNRRKLPVFPKRAMKFVISTTPPNKLIFKPIPKQKIKSKLNTLPYFTYLPKVETFATTEQVTRKPLMKLQKYTIKTRANAKFKGSKKELHTDIQTNTFRQGKNVSTLRSKQFFDESVTKSNILVDGNSENKILNSHTKPNLSKIGEKLKQTNRNTEETLYKEEEQDRNEFIFLENKNSKHQVVDMIESVEHELEEEIETTTDYINMEKVVRVKRDRNNIIEEENISSTASGLKYTGRETRLNNNFYFKNINS